MGLIRILFSRCTALFRRQKLAEELDEELRSHIDFAVEEKVKRGMSAQEARTEAMRALGGVTQPRKRTASSGDLLPLRCSHGICAMLCASCCAIQGSP